MSLFGELRRRNVFKVAAAYLAVAWLILQVVSVISQPLDLPERLDTIVVVLLAVGFPLALLLAWAYELTPEGLQRTADDDTGPLPPGALAGGRFSYGIIAVLALAVAVLLIDRFVIGGQREGAPTDAETLAAAAVAGTAEAAATDTQPLPASTGSDSGERISLAVLPFRNLSSNADVGYFADGLVEQLTTELRRIPELLVTDARAAATAAAAGRSQVEIAAMLGVEHLLEGSVADGAGTLRAALTLTRIESSEQLWDHRFDFGDTDTLTMRDEITAAVASALSVRLGVLASRASWMTRSVAAYDAFLSGLGHSGQFSAAEADAAIRLFERAIALDPEFLLARINLADAHNQRAITARSDEDRAMWRTRADEVMARAREFAQDETAAALLDAIQARQSRDWLSVQSAINKLDAIGFDNGGRSLAIGSFYVQTGRLEAAGPFLEEARAIDPLNPAPEYLLGVVHAARGDLDAAMAAIDRSITLATSAGQIVRVTEGLAWLTPLTIGDRDELERRLRGSPETPSQIPETMLSLLDEPAAALGAIRRFAADPEILSVERGSLAHFAAYFGDYGLALEIMRSLSPEEPFLTLMLWPPVHAGTRQLPGFRDLVTDLGLLAYWREYGWPDVCRPLGSDDFVCE